MVLPDRPVLRCAPFSRLRQGEIMADEIGVTIDELLRDCRTIAVVGLSSNPARPSNRVAAYMQAHGYRVIPVNPNETTVLGEPASPSLADVPGAIDLVNSSGSRKRSFRSLTRRLLEALKPCGCKKGL